MKKTTISFKVLVISILASMGLGNTGDAAASRPARPSSTIYNCNPSNYLDCLAQLAPGDTLQLAAGAYTGGLYIQDKNGTAAQPIVIAGPDSGPPAVFEARGCCNTIDIVDSSYLEIRNLELDGNQLPDVDAVKAGGDPFTNWAHHVTLENLYIHDHDANQQTVGISTKIPAWNWVIRKNVIDSAGTGLYLGDSTGDAPFIAGLIEGNLIVDTIGYNAQIKHQNARPAILGLPTGTNATIIRHNVFSKANNASTGVDARPNLLVGHWPLNSAGSNDVYLIYGNFFYQNPTETLFQGEGNIALYDNLFVNSAGTAINIQQHNDVPRAINVFNNTVVATATGIRVTNVDASYQQRVVGNAVFAATPLNTAATVQVSGNVTGAYASASAYLVNPFAAPGALDLYPQAGQLAGTPLDTSAFTTIQDWNRDFNSALHDGTQRGAYAGSGANPGWLPQLERKPFDSIIINGTVTISGSGVSGVTFTAGGATCSASNGGGVYACYVSPGWGGSITPSKIGHTFTPPSRSYANVTVSQAGQDYTALNHLTNIVYLPITRK